MATDFVFPIMLSLAAGLCTAVGSLVAFFIKKFNPKVLVLMLGFSAGVMIYVSFAEFLPASVQAIGFFNANIAFFAGIALIFLVDYFIPHIYKDEENSCPMGMGIGKSGSLKRVSILMALGVAIHNFPEGIAVLFSSVSDTGIGISVAFAVAMHNIPEGITVSLPCYYATKDRKKAMMYSLLSGLSEPLGAIIALLFLYPYINAFNLGMVYAIVAGIMVFISFDELLPTCLKHKDSHIAILGIFCGMMVMAASMLVTM